MKILSKKWLAAAAMAGAAVMTAGAEEPIITFHTNIYNTYGATNSFHITLGATEDTYIDYDCGYGMTEELIGQATLDADAGEMTGTSIQISVSEAGMVRIYGDASKIDYLGLEGCYISDISFPTLTNVSILNMKHNELTGLDLSGMTRLAAAYLDDNPFSRETPLVVGANHPDLMILSMHTTDWVDPAFNPSDYPALRSLTIYGSPSVTRLDVTGCPWLLQLSADGTSISELDVTKNPNLLILNVSETRVTSLDLSQNPYLTELYIQHEATLNSGYKFKSLDISKNAELQRLFVNGNELTELDLTHSPKLVSLACRRNLLRALSFDNCPNITMVDISKNYMDFNTMPLPRTTMSEYEYEQYPFEMERSYAAGTVLDFTDRVIRPDGSVTSAALFAVSRQDPGNPVLLDAEYYTWDNGKMTLEKAWAGDSVYVAFHNSAFDDYDLTTTRFMVKEAADMNQPVKAVTFATSSIVDDITLYVGIDGATPERPVTFMVDPGNGTRLEFTATTSATPAEPNVVTPRKGANAAIYAPEGVDLTALKMDDMRLTGAMSVENAPMLRELTVTGCNLGSIDLSWNRCLTMLNLSGNKLSTLNLKEPNAYYAKTMLGDINASNNQLTVFETVDPYGLRTLDLSNNKLTSVVTEHATGLKSLKIANNKIEELSIVDCEVLEELDASGNLLSELYIPTYCPLRSVNIAGNRLALPDITLPGFCPDYTYAPQQPMEIAAMAPSINLSHQYMVVDGQATQYEWRYAANDSPVAEGDIRDNGEGKFLFVNPDAGLIYCAMWHPALPQFGGADVLKTTAVKTAGRPDNEFASMVTSADGQVTLSLASTVPNTIIYVDWTGEGDYEQYDLQTTYTLFEARAYAGRTVRFYSYNADDHVSVLSVRRAKLDVLDVSGMKSLYSLGLSGSTIDPANIKFPTGGSLKELIADACGLTELPVDKLATVENMWIGQNPLGTLDLTSLKNLRYLSAPGCELTEIKLANPQLWNLDLSGNKLESIDLSGVPGVSQLMLSNNNLSQIDVDVLSHLQVLQLGGNRFDISTLPLNKSSYLVYHYANQQPIEAAVVDGVVDLSRQASRNGIATQYTWYIGVPEFDENGQLVGEDLYIDEEYTIEGGVTTFIRAYDGVMCVMTNSLFPNLYLYTNLIDVKTAGIDAVQADGGRGEGDVEYYNLQGVRVEHPTRGGIYIRRQGTQVTKVVI